MTKAQVQAGIGAELLSLCQAITEDGQLSSDELLELQRWLHSNRASELPSIEFLVATLNHILADGRVTPEERKELYAAIEKVLPPEARRVAVTHRKSIESELKQLVKEEKEQKKQLEREERERQRPIESINFMVAGVHYEGRPDVIREYVDEGDDVFLVRDANNKFSRNAIEIRLQNGMQIGFVPEDYAPDIAPLLNKGYPHTACITKVLRGGRVPIPVVQAYMHRKEAGIKGLVFPADVPPKRLYSQHQDVENHQGKGCMTLLAILVAPFSIAVFQAIQLLG